jgi:hypothetical protein
MSFATLMVHVDVEPKSDARVRLAAQLADRFASTLIGISACVLPPIRRRAPISSRQSLSNRSSKTF